MVDIRVHSYKVKPDVKSSAKIKERMKELTCRIWDVSNSYKAEKCTQFIREWVNMLDFHLKV